jgi:hypothetical protein
MWRDSAAYRALVRRDLNLEPFNRLGVNRNEVGGLLEKGGQTGLITLVRPPFCAFSFQLAPGVSPVTSGILERESV